MKHTRIFLLIGLSLLTTLAITACSSTASARNPLPTTLPTANYPVEAPSITPEPTAAITLSDKQLTEADAGKTIQLAVGDTLSITLVSNPSTGYTWEAETVDHPVLEQTGDGIYQSQSNLIGAAGKLTLQFKAIAAGTQTLTLDYHRTFEKGVAPAKTFQITVTVIAE